MAFKRVKGLKKSYSAKFRSEHSKNLTVRSGVKANVKSGVDFGKLRSKRRKG